MATGSKRNRTIGNTARIKAVGYMRTSSATNVGADKDSEKRQREAIQAFADRAGYVIADADWYYDAAVSGKDPIETRKGFADLLTRIESNGVRHVIVESLDRFARQLIVQETGIALLKTRDVALMSAATGDDVTNDDDPARTMLRQVVGAFAEYEKARLVSKLKHGREARKARGLRPQGRIGLVESNPEVVALAKKLHRANPITGKHMPLREIAEKLVIAGHCAASGKPFSASVIKRMVEA